MPGILSKNCVLSGELDSYCLVCRVHLSTERDALAHIQHSLHKLNLSSHNYLHNYQQHSIRKVAGVYFCELCDTTLATAAKVRLHVTEHTHLQQRGRMLRRASECIVFHDVMITDNAWHGLVSDTCVLCDVDFEHDSTHKAEQSHVLNLIKSKVLISDNDDVYRQIDDSYQCLTCNKVVLESVINEHLDSTEHKSLITKCAPHKDDVTQVKGEGEYFKYEPAEKEHAQCNNDVTDKSAHEARDIKSTKDVLSENNDKPLYTKPVKKNKKQKKATSSPKHVESINKRHGLSDTKDDDKAPCNTSSDKEHVSGSKHKDQQTPTNIDKVLMKEFVKSLNFTKIRSSPSDHGDADAMQCIVLNDSFLLQMYKFFGLLEINNIIICQLCSKPFPRLPIEIIVHLNSKQHKDMIENCYIISSLENEFVRQLKPNLYDCTICGSVQSNWEDMMKHLASDTHKKVKNAHDNLLIEYKTTVHNRREHSLPYDTDAMIPCEGIFTENNELNMFKCECFVSGTHR